MRKYAYAVIICWLLLAVPLPAICGQPFVFETEEWTAPRTNVVRKVVKGEVLVKFKKNITDNVKRQMHGNINAKVKGVLSEIGIEVIRLPVGMSVGDGVNFYNNLPEVEYAEPNHIRRAFLDSPNDTYYSNQWGLSKIDVQAAWEKTTGTNTIIVAVIDTGVDYTHPDLSVAVDSTTGYDFINDDNDAIDDNDHGTHVAGIIAAATNNGIGIAGVAGGWGAVPGIKIMPIKILDAGGSAAVSYISTAVIRAANAGARVINMSLGDTQLPPVYSSTEYDACKYAYDKGCVVVAASGNGYDSNGDGIIDTSGMEPVSYPAAYDIVIAVGATDSSDKRASFSNYGDDLDIVAPGTSIRSTIRSSDYADMSGTSMATPFVSGVVSLILSKDPSLTPADVYTKLVESADGVGASGWDKETGYGRLNGASAMGYVTPLVAKVMNAPNPFNPLSNDSQKNITRVYLPGELKGSYLKMYVFNIAGEKIRTVESGLASRADWDGRNDNNNVVANGIYFYVVETNKGRAKGKITVIKE